MNKEKIIEMILSQDGTPNGTFITLDVLRCERIADELISLIEQEKKAQAKEIFEKLAEKGNFTYDYPDEPHCPIVIYNVGILQDLADEYGVEL